MADFWVDVDNPPQAQYLSPIAAALRSRGHSVLLTARDHPATLEVLANRGETPLAVGGSFGASGVSKAIGTLRRAARLRRLVAKRIGRPAAVVSTARAGVLAARALGRPAFTVLDYEGVELGVFRRSGTVLLHPDVIPPERFTRQGFPAERLRAFQGLKEDLAFAGLEPDGVEPAVLPAPRDASLPAVLVRPPSQTSHYRSEHSVAMLGAVLDRLAALDDVQVVLAPREADQVELLGGRSWAVPAVVLERALPMVPLLRAVDRVVTGGGTMLREAAWLGVPGISVFQGPMPAVDEWLEGEGAIRRVSDAAAIESIEWGRRAPGTGLARHPEALEEVLAAVLGSGTVAAGGDRGDRGAG